MKAFVEIAGTTVELTSFSDSVISVANGNNGLQVLTDALNAIGSAAALLPNSFPGGAIPVAVAANLTAFQSSLLLAAEGFAQNNPGIGIENLLTAASSAANLVAMGVPAAKGLAIAITVLNLAFKHHEEIANLITPGILDPAFELFDKLSNFLTPSGDTNPNARIAGLVCSTFFSACTTPASDPLTLDLDGDGIETVGINSASPVMFDIPGRGVLQSVGWVGADDGFLVRDLNGNGIIDSGAELFGDATQLANGQRASDGFAALADLDANQDGVVNAADAAFASLRVWCDLDQDGVTDAGELLTLAALGITGLNVASTSHSQTLASGNQIANLGTYIRSDGQVGAL